MWTRFVGSSIPRDTYNYYRRDKRHFMIKENLFLIWKQIIQFWQTCEHFIHTPTTYLEPREQEWVPQLSAISNHWDPANSTLPQERAGNRGAVKWYVRYLSWGHKFNRQSRNYGESCFLPLLSRASEFPNTKFQEPSATIFAASKYVVAQAKSLSISLFFPLILEVLGNWLRKRNRWNYKHLSQILLAIALLFRWCLRMLILRCGSGFCLFLKQGFHKYSMLALNLPYTPGWPQTQINPPAPASWVLGLQTRASIIQNPLKPELETWLSG